MTKISMENNRKWFNNFEHKLTCLTTVSKFVKNSIFLTVLKGVKMYCRRISQLSLAWSSILHDWQGTRGGDNNQVKDFMYTVWIREYWMTYRGPGFLAVVGSGSFPTLSSLLSFPVCICLWRERGRGDGGETARSLVLYKSFNSLLYGSSC